MDVAHWLLPIGGALGLSLLTWWSCSWWYGRRVAELQGRLEKLRHSAGQHVAQARHQIMLLQKELAARPALTKAQIAQRDAAADAAARKAALEAKLDEAPTMRLPPRGFVDTQPLTRPPQP